MNAEMKACSVLKYVEVNLIKMNFLVSEQCTSVCPARPSASETPRPGWSVRHYDAEAPPAVSPAPHSEYGNHL